MPESAKSEKHPTDFFLDLIKGLETAWEGIRFSPYRPS